MKILVLMPCDEQHAYAATGIYKALPIELKDRCFAMPMFMEYLIDTKMVGNWIMAFYDSMISAKTIYNSTDENEDLIIIGNMDKSFEFDIVFNFQEIDESLPYADNFITKIKEIVAGEPLLSGYICNLHTADESKLALRNCIATADFLAHYIKTKPNLEKIEKDFKYRIGKLKELKNANIPTKKSKQRSDT